MQPAALAWREAMQNINIEDIMAEIREEIRNKGYKDDEIQFGEILLSSVATPYNMQAYKEELEKMANDRMVLSYRDISSDRPGLGTIVTFFKKIVRRLTAFYIEPVVDDQNKFNEEAVNLFAQALNKFAEDDEKISELERQLYDCKKQCMALEEKLKEKE